MDAAALPDTLIFQGTLDERCELESLQKSLSQVRKAGDRKTVTVDLSQVKYANSVGILTWLKFVQSAPCGFRYVNAPAWLVKQFNMMTGYFINGGFVASFQAPFFNSQTEESVMLTLTVGADVELRPDYGDYQLPNADLRGKHLEPDFDPGQYFSFLAENCEPFRALAG